MRSIDADALVPDFLVTSSAYNTCKSYVSMEQIQNAQTIEPEITQEDIELYCRRRCLTVITDDLYNEMKMRWSVQPTHSNAPNTLDAISRQAAIDAALLFMVEYCGAAFDEDMQTKMKQRLEDLSSAQQWTPVSEGLPEVDEEVWVTDDAGGMATVHGDSCGRYVDTGEKFWYTSQNVTAWMPMIIPEPYRGD